MQQLLESVLPTDGFITREVDIGARELLLKLFNKSVLKQQKWKELYAVLGDLEGKACLDLGSDNGVISYLLRSRGGTWCSGDLNGEVVESIASVVGNAVFLTDGTRMPIEDKSLDLVVVVDMLEHVREDTALIQELSRIMKPGAKLIINVPNRFPRSILRALRHMIGQTDEAHGHIRPGYNRQDLLAVLGTEFLLEETHTYSRFFAEVIDTLIVYAYSLMCSPKKGPRDPEATDQDTSKGLVVTGEQLGKFEKKFRIYSMIYPFIRAVSALDKALLFQEGFMRLAVARKSLS